MRNKIIKYITSLIPFPTLRKKCRKNLKEVGLLYFMKEKKSCPICGEIARFRTLYGFLKNTCPNCKSLPWQRYVSFIYKAHFMNSKEKISILYFAPSKGIFAMINKHKNIKVIPVDFDPDYYEGVYNFAKPQKEDAMNLSFEDEVFDYYLSNHVFEHLVDDKKALDECFRVLKKGGMALITVPIKSDKTWQDKSINSDEGRKKHYGQFDHVRAYGKDVIQYWKKLKPDFIIQEIKSDDFFVDEQISKKYGIDSTSVFLLKKSFF
jgi:SAM-dependent methyltransferase